VLTDDPHPFITAWRTRDVHSWAAHFAPDIVLRSPIIESTFEGSATAAELFGALFESFDAFEVTEHLANGQCHAFVWHGALGRHPVEGIDRIRHNDDGSIAEITVYIRPLVGIATTANRVRPRVRRPTRPPARTARARDDPPAPCALRCDRSNRDASHRKLTPPPALTKGTAPRRAAPRFQSRDVRGHCPTLWWRTMD
jgi:ketosteroid isomerase-like protein